MSIASAADLVHQVFAGDNRKLKVLAARGVLPLPPAELIPVQVRLAREADPEIAGRAAAALRAVEPRILVDYINEQAAIEELTYLSGSANHPTVLEALMRRRDMPPALLATLAPRLEPELQEILILRQDAIVEEPAILDHLEKNPNLSRFVARRIGEYRQHLLAPKPERKKEEAPQPDEEFESPLDDPEVQEAIVEVAQTEPPAGDLDETTGLTEGQIRALPVPVRTKLARGAPKTLRSILVRDTNPAVAVSVLTNNAMSDEEVEQIARNRSVCDEVLAEIARNRQWTVKYGICVALVNNPKTPVGLGVRLVARLAVRDLRALKFNRNVSDAVRRAAHRMYMVKSA